MSTRWAGRGPSLGHKGKPHVFEGRWAVGGARAWAIRGNHMFLRVGRGPENHMFVRVGGRWAGRGPGPGHKGKPHVFEGRWAVGGAAPGPGP